MLTPDLLKSNGLENIYSANYFLRGSKSRFFTEDVYNELARNLRPSKHSVIKRLPKNLNREQENLTKSVPNKKQKVRGPAGCGKTLVLAYRAVNAYKRTQEPVIILTYNITLCNYIRDNISAILGDITNKNDVMQYFKITNYHNFITQYRAENDQLDVLEFDPRKGKNVDTYNLERIDEQFSTILVDEVQDYKRQWIDTIHKLLKPNGELVFFGDEEQNLYRNALIEDEGKKNRIYTGVGGRWNSLKKTYRLSGKISDLARAFQLTFFKDYDDNEITPAVQQTLDFADTTIEYHFTKNFNVGEVVKIFFETVKKYGVHNDDVCILSQVRENIRLIDKALRDRNLKTITTVASVEDWAVIEEKYPIPAGADEFEVQNINAKRKDEIKKIERPLKRFFYMESGKVKLSTIHSYKGWSADTEILILSNQGIPLADEPTFLNDEMVYTSITRAVNHLVIINIDNEKYDKFFKQYLGQ